jgi:hypothetical protein
VHHWLIWENRRHTGAGRYGLGPEINSPLNFGEFPSTLCLLDLILSDPMAFRMVSQHLGQRGDLNQLSLGACHTSLRKIKLCTPYRRVSSVFSKTHQGCPMAVAGLGLAQACRPHIPPLFPYTWASPGQVYQSKDGHQERTLIYLIYFKSKHIMSLSSWNSPFKHSVATSALPRLSVPMEQKSTCHDQGKQY